MPPTPPELVSMEHVKLHFEFLKDPKKKMEQEDMDLLEAHAKVDKATLTKLMAEGKVKQASAEMQANQPNAQPNANASQGGKPQQVPQ